MIKDFVSIFFSNLLQIDKTQLFCENVDFGANRNVFAPSGGSDDWLWTISRADDQVTFSHAGQGQEVVFSNPFLFYEPDEEEPCLAFHAQNAEELLLVNADACTPKKLFVTHLCPQKIDELKEIQQFEVRNITLTNVNH